MKTNANEARDILSHPVGLGVVYCLPVVAIIASGSDIVSPGWHTAIWAAALVTMGAACIVNALRCRRVHCYFTGPFLLLMAIVTLLYGLGTLPLGNHGWSLISATLIAGVLALWCLPEFFFGRYRTSPNVK